MGTVITTIILSYIAAMCVSGYLFHITHMKDVHAYTPIEWVILFTLLLFWPLWIGSLWHNYRNPKRD